MFRSRECLVERRERRCDVTRRGQTLRECAEHERVKRDETRAPKFVERSTEQLESLTHVAAVDESDSVVSPYRSMSGSQRVSCRIVEQRRHVAFGGHQVAAPDGDER